MKSKIAVFPGSFDPVTKGHESIVRRALPLFDAVVVAIGTNAAKQYLFPAEQRRAWIEKTFAEEKKVRCETYDGLTVDFCRRVKATHLLRGIRTSADFEFERAVASVNRTLAPEIETLCLFALPEFSAITSTIIRDILKNGGDAGAFVPAAVTLRT